MVSAATLFIVDASAVIPTNIFEVTFSILELSMLTDTKSSTCELVILKAAIILDVREFNTTSFILLSMLDIEVKSIAVILDTKSEILVGISVVSILTAELRLVLVISVVKVPMLVFSVSKELPDAITFSSSIKKLATAAVKPEDKSPTPVTNKPILVLNNSNTMLVSAPSPDKDCKDCPTKYKIELKFCKGPPLAISGKKPSSIKLDSKESLKLLNTPPSP